MRWVFVHYRQRGWRPHGQRSKSSSGHCTADRCSQQQLGLNVAEAYDTLCVRCLCWNLCTASSECAIARILGTHILWVCWINGLASAASSLNVLCESLAFLHSRITSCSRDFSPRPRSAVSRTLGYPEGNQRKRPVSSTGQCNCKGPTVNRLCQLARVRTMSPGGDGSCNVIYL